MDPQFALCQRAPCLEQETQNRPKKSTIEGGLSLFIEDMESSALPPAPNQRFTPLPDIPRADDVYFRTESRLLKESSPTKFDSMNCSSNQTTCNKSQSGSSSSMNRTPLVILKETNSTRYQQHFGSSTKSTKTIPNYSTYRLPALTGIYNHSLPNPMDLDEDLPINASRTYVDQTQRNVHTSPGDRIISPIKRPQAPSPPTSAFIRRKVTDDDNETTVNYASSCSDSDDDFIQ